jgi:hypothetical protein
VVILWDFTAICWQYAFRLYLNFFLNVTVIGQSDIVKLQRSQPVRLFDASIN